MELSVIRIHKVGAASGQPWLNTRPVVHPDKYLSQCPFILLNEETYEPQVDFPVQSRKGVMAVTLVLDGSAYQTDDAGARWLLGQGDAAFSISSGGILQGTANVSGVQLLHLWVNLPGTLRTTSARHQVVRRAEASRATIGNASALLYAGALDTASGPHTGAWPLTVADLSLQAGQTTTLALASNERSFVYVVRGHVALGRNQVNLGRDSIAWIERTVGPADVNSLTARAAAEDTRLLLFSSPVFGENASLGKSCDPEVADSLAGIARAPLRQVADTANITTPEART